jgi:hypothetical protein
MEWAKVRRRAAKTEAQTAPLGHTQPCTPTMQEFRYQQRRHLTRSGTQHDPDSGRRGRGAALPAKPTHQRFVRLAERRARCGGRGARFQTCLLPRCAARHEGHVQLGVLTPTDAVNNLSSRTARCQTRFADYYHIQSPEGTPRVAIATDRCGDPDKRAGGQHPAQDP